MGPPGGGDDPRQSPAELKIASAQMRRGRDSPFPRCLQAEYRIVSRIAYGDDFYEGIRAAIIDKEIAPAGTRPHSTT